MPRAEAGTLGAEEPPSPLARQRMQEHTPKENPSMNYGSEKAERRAVFRKQVKVLLTPLSMEEEKRNKRLPQKRLLEKFSSNEGPSEREPKVKKSRGDPTSQEIRDVSYKASSSPRGVIPNMSSLHNTTSMVSPTNTSVTADHDSENNWDTDSEGSNSGVSYLDGSSQLSAYERKRLKNITENANFFASLKLLESAARLRKMATKGQSHGIKRVKPKKTEAETVRRRSMRLQRVDPSGVPLPEIPAQPEPVIDEYPQLPPGPLPMVPANPSKSSESTDAFLETWTKISQINPNDTEKYMCNLERYKASLSYMILSEDAVTKVVKNRIYSVAIHPSESRTLVAAGDKSGQIGLWDLNSKSEDGVYVFIPHSQPVSCMYFSPFNPVHLLSLSHDGTVRCGDVTRAVFEEVYRSEENSFSSFDFLADNASTLVVGQWDGDVAIVDRRTPGTSSELTANINSKTTRTVHVHPVNRQYFIAAGAVNVCIFDARYLKPNGNKPISFLSGHTKSVASAYFSPITGNRVVTTCADDTLRVYDTSSLSSMIPVLTAVRHNNNTGRWLTRFRAIWDPKQEDCFVVGSMARPRQIEIFQDTGEQLHSFYNVDYLGSVCSINAVHPTKNILVGGNSSGRLHVFKD
ncbi:WD repeat-containing protein 76 isoform X1 [Trachemys scripta elegans]|uniref:WD repeat-containing protein 76 isoform X1 n=2 Tax=Trachemys scripta elegans TaxID=31138 RepID=UPI0015527971|nr:WD repeat-containing protein 76 isoform X1 [Trachemys scripta elegans]